MSRWAGVRRRLGSIRLSLILLALVPSVTLTAVWGMTTVQILSEGLRLRSQTELSRSTGALGTDAMLALQRERKLSAVRLATPRTPAAALGRQRAATDAAVAKLTARTDIIADAPERGDDALRRLFTSLRGLEHTRHQVDKPGGSSPEGILAHYDRMIDAQIQAFQGLAQVDDGELTSQAAPLFPMEQAAELLAREDARLTVAWPSGHIDGRAWEDFAKFTHTRRWLLEDELVPMLADSGVTTLETAQDLRSPQWRTMRAIEDQVLKGPRLEDDSVELPRAQQRWEPAAAEISGRYSREIRMQTGALLDRSTDRAGDLLLTATALSAGGLVALLLCVGLSWRITRSLSRRLNGLRVATLDLAERRLPDVVARLERGEKVDARSATVPLDQGDDELGEVAKAFDTAQRTAVLTAIELAHTRTGFQKVILGIARHSQNLVNRQLGRLDALERRHRDPEILQELYELDSLAAQLRRYEENLVVVSGARPGRSWSKPVAVTDIVHSAVGEVAEYQRVQTHTEDDVALAPPAVADVIHLLAELIDNATAYSPAPSPVTVRAALVANGLAVEVEDKGLGLSEADYAALNAQLVRPMKFDVMALAEDLRLGMFVISQLAHRHGITVTLRRSPYGGTTAVMLIPRGIVVRNDAATPPARGGGLPQGGRPPLTTIAARNTERAEPPAPAPAPAPVDAVPPEWAPPTRVPDSAPAAEARPGHREGLVLLPRRVPQTSLAAELRAEASPAAGDPAQAPADRPGEFSAEAASSSLAGFQRGTHRARDSAAEQ
ncbi:nitrate- and nitrite sensing domain-containing protein [Streptomyces gramineus]|uniref:sensor histidine kinase n=1 Tax=Streptomyces gramineus TaxID=910542 RepID=UPI00398AAECF